MKIKKISKNRGLCTSEIIHLTRKYIYKAEDNISPPKNNICTHTYMC